jgi:DHA1 family tetracycline resistance protein-like MFS transporter
MAKGLAEDLIANGAQIEVPATALVMVLVTMFVDTLAGSVSAPVLPYYAKSFGVGVAQIGWLYAVWSFSSTFFAPQLTRISDRVGRRPVLLASLLGAGFANILQGLCTSIPLYGFYVFVFARFFSGIWAAVGSTCNVYVTDVVPEESRAAFLAKLSLIFPLAIFFGPGIGGGLSKFGLNVPVLVDGSFTLASFIFVFIYLPETPAFLRTKQARKDAAEGKAPPDAGQPVKTPFAVHILGFSNLLMGVGLSTRLSTYAILMKDSFEWTALEIGFNFMAGSLVMMLTNIFICPRITKIMGEAGSLAFGRLLQAIGYIGFALSHEIWITLIFYVFVSVGDGINFAMTNAYLANFTHPTNRGAVFGTAAVYMNLGRMIGPVSSTHLAAYFGSGTPGAFGAGASFVMASLVSLVGSVLPLAVVRLQPKKSKPLLQKRDSAYGDDWVDEEGTNQDYEALGRHVAGILKRKHYKWVSRREEVELFLDTAIPELHTSCKDTYESEWHSVLHGGSRANPVSG